MYRIVAHCLLTVFQAAKRKADMILSSDELEILDYLKSWKGKFVTMMEISRSAGGRRKFREDEHWAKPLMARLVESHLIEVNERGHYKVVPEKQETAGGTAENYFPEPKTPGLIGEDYFPTIPQTDKVPERWVSPQVAQILKRAGKQIGGHKAKPH